ncbi:hypothetical protein M407DRAFT_28824 [Tulasnella calospora MUT 4182]|uniref:Uncharacterized protein n=1 Tax=Tulasnella calospora MUT 4182 TaxID=1051891 RepID=A0A0C3QA21_9AGAM|nr:hypothetical protein M407DRAFT_28824 [Tulasnella calospora MUT 4182]
MTSIDPSHIPNPFAREDRWGQATYSFNREEDAHYGYHRPSHSNHQPVHLPKIPELRFEQAYLLSIKPFIHPGNEGDKDAGKGKEKESSKGDAAMLLQEGVLTETDSVYGVPLRIDWGSVAWVTLRDQVISPLLQGAAWGTASVILIPLARQGITQLFGFGPSVSNPPSTTPKDATPPATQAEVGPWRRWVRSLLGGVQTNAALAR